MKTDLKLSNLTVEQCTSTTWNDVLDILKDTNMDIWLTGDEVPDEFCIVRDTETGNAISCFKFSQEEKIGILKNFAVRTMLQKKGIGIYIANNLIPRAAKERDMKRLYLTGNNIPPNYTSNNFWKKTIYKHFPSKDIKDKYFQDYFNYYMEKFYPHLFYKESCFYLDLENHG